MMAGTLPGDRAIESGKAKMRPETLGTISSEALGEAWKSEYGIDVSPYLPGSEVALRRVEPAGYYRFEPAFPGSDQFYSNLMRARGYDSPSKAEFLAAASEISPAEKVLDVGCGTGNFSLQCRGEYTGLETNPGAVEDAIALGRHVTLGLLEDVPPSSYDVVTLFQVLEHVPDPESFISVAARCLRPGGKIIVSTPDQDGVIGRAANQLLNYPPHHLTWWSEEALVKLLADCGCQTTRVWHEPLQKHHYSVFIQALLRPADERHITRSPGLLLARAIAKVISPMIRKAWPSIPFVRGHTIMVVAQKKLTSS
jgi:SAM-dependent methyltransferase